MNEPADEYPELFYREDAGLFELYKDGEDQLAHTYDERDARVFSAAYLAIKALKAVEWRGWNVTEDCWQCPDCGARPRHGLHYVECKIGAALLKAGEALDVT